MALLDLRKIDYIIRNVCFFWISFLSLKRNLQLLHNTHTSKKKTSKCSTNTCAGFFEVFSTSINKILLDAQIKEYNTKLSTTPNTYDESGNDSNTTPTAPQLQNLNHYQPLSLVPRHFRNITQTDLITSRSNYQQSPIQHLTTQETSIEDTYKKII